LYEPADGFGAAVQGGGSLVNVVKKRFDLGGLDGFGGRQLYVSHVRFVVCFLWP
jgi:hypothetical protein